MDVLESQVEALIFNYLSFGFLNTVHTFWTLIAVLTAAVSFWRIRALGSILSSPQKTDDIDCPPSFHHDVKFNGFEEAEAAEEEEEEKEKERAIEICSCSYSSSTFVSAVAIDGNVKSKVTVYIDDEDNSNGYVSDENDEVNVNVNLKTDLGEEEKIVHVYGGDWEMEGMLMMRKRMEDFGWYRCQDLTSLNGSVVKLWEGRRSSSTITLDGGVGRVGKIVVGVRV